MAGVQETGTFRHKNILPHGRFGTGNFWPHTKQYGRYFGTCAEMFQLQYGPVPKRPHAEISRCRKVPMRKSSHAE